MISDLFSHFKARDELLRKLNRAHAPSKSEVEKQRVSFVYGVLDEKARLTREQVQKIVESAT